MLFLNTPNFLIMACYIIELCLTACALSLESFFRLFFMVLLLLTSLLLTDPRLEIIVQRLSSRFYHVWVSLVLFFIFIFYHLGQCREFIFLKFINFFLNSLIHLGYNYIFGSALQFYFVLDLAQAIYWNILSLTKKIKIIFTIYFLRLKKMGMSLFFYQRRPISSM